MATAKKSSAAKTAAKKKPVKAAAKTSSVKKAVVKKAPVSPASLKLRRTGKGAAKKLPAQKPVVKKSVAKKTAPQGAQGIPEQMRDAALKILDARKAEEIVCINLTGRSSMADYLIIASGRAGRQVSAIADYLREAFFKLGVRQIRIEGQSEANWVLVDGGDVVVHLFRPEVRSYYDLDAIWNGKTAKA